MKTRYIAALAASSLAVAVIAPSAAQAATTGGGVHHLVAGALGAAPHATKPTAGIFQKNVVVRGHATTASDGLTVALAATQTGAESFSFAATSNVAVGTTVTSYSIDFGDGSAAQTNTNGNFSSYKYAWAGTYTATVTATDSTGATATSTVTVTTEGSDYTAYGPTRILDTRNGTGAPAAAVAANGVVKLNIAGAGISGNTIPAGVTAVAMNVTVTQAKAAGFITAYPDGTSEPNASNINYGPGTTIPDLVVVQVGSDGTVDLANNSSGSVQLVADVVGYYTQTKASQYVAISPYRLLDTRSGTGTNGVVKQIPANGSITVNVAGANGGAIPSSGVTAIAANITVTNPRSNGFITAYPSDQQLPNASNVNYAPGQTVPNMAVVPVGGTTGAITVHNTSSGSVDVIVDVSGYYQDANITGASSSYVAFPPERILDTRTWNQGSDLPLPANSFGQLYGWTDSTVTSAVFTATVTNPQTNGFITLYPVNTGTSAEIPNASNVNYGHGQTVANMAFVSLGTTPLGDGSSDGFTGYWFGVLNASNGSTDLVLDNEGVFLNN